MEIFELRYFLGVAEQENIHRASKKLRVSPSSLSKAIARLEEELGVRLFRREGRGIQLTDQGRFLQRKASEMVQLEEIARTEISGHRTKIHAIITGPEILLTRYGLDLGKKLKQRHPDSLLEFRPLEDSLALEQIFLGESHLALITSELPTQSGLTGKLLDETTFQTYVGQGHPLYPAATAKRPIDIQEVLKTPFVSPSNPILGKVGNKQSLDGWRDDHFPRKLEFLTSSLKLMEDLLVSGQAAAYLPSYYCEPLKVLPLKIKGCPYSCSQKIRLVAKNPKERGWLNHLF